MTFRKLVFRIIISFMSWLLLLFSGNDDLLGIIVLWYVNHKNILMHRIWVPSNIRIEFHQVEALVQLFWLFFAVSLNYNVFILWNVPIQPDLSSLFSQLLFIKK